ncbi:MAG: branched-chain amino acid ABC transporter permease [Anaerolineae bacterium]
MHSEQLLQFFVSGLANGSIYALVAIGFTITFSATQLISFAQGEFGMIAGFLTLTFYQAIGLPLLAAILLAIITVAGLGFFLERLTMRPFYGSGHLQVITITIGAGVLLKAAAAIIWGKEYEALPSFSGDAPINVAGAAIMPQSLWIMGVTLVAVALLALFYQRTAWGKAIQAAAMNPLAANLVGVPVDTVTTVAFTVGAGMSALAGVLIAPISFVHFNAGTFLGLKGFSAAVLGGMGSFPGAIVGGLVLGLVEAFGAGLLSSGYKSAIALGVLLLVLMLRPGGIVGSTLGHMEEV